MSDSEFPVRESSPKSRHIPELEGLRGILSFLVVLAHVWAPAVIWVWGSMDIFFCMSGFLISLLLIREQKKPGYLLTYALRRVLRIWPSYYALLIVCVGGTALMTMYVKPSFSIGSGTLRSVFFLQFTEVWFKAAAIPDGYKQYLPFLNHTWSVALEEQFYVTAPLLCWCIARTSKPVRTATILLLAATTTGIVGRGYGMSWSTLPLRFDGFAAGIWAAFLVNTVKEEWLKTSSIQIWLGTLLAGCLVIIGVLSFFSADNGTFKIREPKEPPYVYGITLYALASAAIMFLLYNNTGHRWLALLRIGLFRFLGRMSYSLYLWHFPTIYFCGCTLLHWGTMPRLESMIIELLVSYLVAYGAYITIERPAMNIRP